MAEPQDLELAGAADLQLLFERGAKVDDETFGRIFKEATTAADSSGAPYLVMGGLASSLSGRPRWTHDIDLFTRPDQAPLLLEAFDEAGFTTQETYPDWLFKALKEGVLVDIIFRSAGDIYLDDEMVERCVKAHVHGVEIRAVCPEDLLVIKAIAHAEHSPRHWHDALAIIAKNNLDWEYVVRRASHGIRRILSLLVYGQSCDMTVPDEPILALIDKIYSRETVS